MERKEYWYDTELFKARNSRTALKLHAEFISKYCPRENGQKPRPQFFEMDRDNSEIDSLWGVPMANRSPFTKRSPICLPALNTFDRPDWRLTKVGLVPSRKDKFWLANLHLQEADYFPNRGDQVFWDGYRYTIMNVVIPPESYWGTSNLWLGLVCECVIAPEGDARPLGELSKVAPAELTAGVAPLPVPVRPVPTSFS